MENMRIAFDVDHAVALSATPLECRECHVMHTLFVNRDGRTMCVECDERRVRITSAARGAAAPPRQLHPYATGCLPAPDGYDPWPY